MKGPGLYFLLVVCVVSVLAAPCPGADTTIILQKDLNGYTGVSDTGINTSGWADPPQHTVNYGRNTELYLERSGDGNILITFDLSGIPSNSTIISASLSLYNITDADDNPQGLNRRVNLFQILRDWDEGNQTDSPVDAAGKHGATGDNAFDYFGQEGTDVAWSERGMAEGTDYASTAQSHADVAGEGWVSWDLTALVRSWVRGDTANYGLVLRDATGYEDGNPDWRVFVSSEAATDSSLRPKLTIVYNPDVPYADAGTDVENFSWNGGPLTLDGSGSHAASTDSSAGLTFLWEITGAAYGSAMGSTAIGTGQTAAFTPDTAGEWTIRLTVTSSTGESATDTVNIRLLSIPASHPRIYLTPAKLQQLQARAVDSNTQWARLKAEADASDGEMHAKALAGVITGSATYCRNAVDSALALIAEPSDYATKAGDIALVYDFCHSCLTPAEQDTFLDYFTAWAADTPKDEDTSGWGNYWPRYGYSYALIGLAAYGDTENAADWIDEYRHRRFRDADLPLLAYIADGGAWPEGVVYDWVANCPRVKAVEAWTTATGENLFESTGWFQNRLGYLLLHQWPGVADQWGYYYHPYVSAGDSERNRGSMANYGRIMGLILAGRYPDTALSGQLTAYLSASPVNGSMDFLAHDEFLWFDPDAAAATPQLLSHYAAGTGRVLMRSGWPDGAADTDTSPTVITFQCGEHFCYHQHFDQNSFTLFKYAPLALDSGVYSQEGTSNHDINYYVRTIAHNTLVVYNPLEDFSYARPDAASNDGGQRDTYPATRAPQTMDYYRQYTDQYDTGDMLRFEDSVRYTYALGDATKAYNNTTYNQAMDTALSGNTAKLSRFMRELVYLRPEAAGAADYVVLFDRVGVTSSSYSGENTKLLFHTMGEPVVTGGTEQSVSSGETLYVGADQAVAVNGSGKLFIRPLLPESVALRKVGGRGVKSFWVFDDNYDWHWDASESQPRPVNNFETTPYGEWRIELEPGDTALAHNFLTILYPTGSSTPSMPDTALISGTGISGVEIEDQRLHRVVVFSSDTGGSPPTGAITYTCRDGKPSDHLIVDLAPSTGYRLDTAVSDSLKTVTLTPDTGGSYQASDQGVLNFMLGPDDGVAVTGLSITGTPAVNSPITFTVTAQGDKTPLYYRFSVHPDYGTSGYDGRHWTSMTTTEYTTESSVTHTFTARGKYIVVVWVSTVPDSTVSQGVPIAGCSVNIGDDACGSRIMGLAVSGTRKTNSPMAFTVVSENTCSADFYRFSVHPDYGTAGYDGRHWTPMTDTEWVSSNSVDYTFTKPGKYIVVVWVSSEAQQADTTGIPIIGWSVNID